MNHKKPPEIFSSGIAVGRLVTVAICGSVAQRSAVELDRTSYAVRSAFLATAGLLVRNLVH